MLFKDELKAILQEMTGDHRVSIKNQEEINKKEGLCASYCTLRTHYLAKNESKTKNEGVYDMFMCTMPLKKTPSAQGHNEPDDYGISFKNIFYYEKMESFLKAYYNGDMWAPTYVATSVEGGKYQMLFQSTKRHGYKKRDIFNDLKHIKIALNTMACLHCASIFSETRVRECEKKDDPAAQQNIFGDEFKDAMFDNANTIITRFFKIGMQITDMLTRTFNVTTISVVLNKLGELCKVSKKHCNVICHGDPRKENMLFTIAPTVNPCIFYNFYFMRYAPLALDVLQLIYANTSQDFRKIHMDDLVKGYNDALHEIKKKFDRTPKNLHIPNEEKTKEAITDLRVFGPAVTLVFMSLSLLNLDDIKLFLLDYTKESSNPMEFLTEEKIKVLKTEFKQNIPFQNRFRELVIETVKLGRLKRY